MELKEKNIFKEEFYYVEGRPFSMIETNDDLEI